LPYGKQQSSLGLYAPLQKVIVSFVMTVCPSAWNNSPPFARIFRKFYIWDLFGKFLQKFKFHWNLTRISGTLHEDKYNLLIITCSVLLRMNNKTSSISMTQHLGSFVQPLLQWKNNKCFKFWVCICRLRYPVCNAHAHFYLVFCDPLGCTLLYTFSHKRQDFRKKGFEHKLCVLIFSRAFVWNISLYKKNWTRCDHKFTLLFMKIPIILLWW
jgi:hypothetical protein